VTDVLDSDDPEKFAILVVEETWRSASADQAAETRHRHRIVALTTGVNDDGAQRINPR
jgi:hypothetical protein